jgi:hypothetical protein
MRKNGTPYYIGKGNNSRAWNRYGHRIHLPKDKKYIIMLETNLTEVGAAAIERRMIRWYGRKDLGTGILLNMTDGGDGWSGAKHTKEQLKKMSESQKGRKFTKEHKKKISLGKMGKNPWNKGLTTPFHVRDKISKNHYDVSGVNNPMHGKKHSDQTRKKIAEARNKKWILVLPCGSEIVIDNLEEYCKTNNLSKVVLWRTSRENSKNKTYKGYKLKVHVNEKQ